jgi:hypothetical protein
VTANPRNSGLRIIALVTVATIGCATSYAPRPSHRLAFVESGGALRLTRDSQSFGIWHVDQAVAGNPQAEVEARTYVHRTTAGLVLDLAGIGLVVGGSVLGNSSSSRARRDEGAGLVFGGFASITTAIVLVVTGVPHLYDAINIYNDGVPRDAGP